MIALETGLWGYQNDIAEVIRAFVGFVDIQAAPFSCAPGFAVRVERIGAHRIRAEGRKEPNGQISVSERGIRGQGENALLQKREEKRAVKIAVYEVMRALLPETTLPWGSLTGIRPTKLYRELCDTEGEVHAKRMFLSDFDVTEEKARLAEEIVAVQRPILNSVRTKDVDIYIGIPYCRTRCLYCSFLSEVVGKNGVPREYLDALYRDISMGAALVKKGGYTVRALYMGGGTPTVLPSDEMGRLIAHTYEEYGVCGPEFTVEAGRPDTLDAEKLHMLRSMGVTRISLNPQSMNEGTLKRIGRGHTPEDICIAYNMAMEAGIRNVNMDVIAGLPGERLDDMEQTLLAIEAMSPASLTVHTLAVKRSSGLKERLGAYPLPTAQETARMAALGMESAERLGMRPYYMYRQKYMSGSLENVGYAKKGFECVYNVDMMEEAVNILAHGAGAMSKRVFHSRDARVERVPAPKDIGTYIRKLDTLRGEKEGLFLQDTTI